MRSLSPQVMVVDRRRHFPLRSMCALTTVEQPQSLEEPLCLLAWKAQILQQRFWPALHWASFPASAAGFERLAHLLRWQLAQAVFQPQEHAASISSRNRNPPEHLPVPQGQRPTEPLSAEGSTHASALHVSQAEICFQARAARGWRLNSPRRPGLHRYLESAHKRGQNLY